MCRSDTSHVLSCSDVCIICPEERYSAWLVVTDGSTPTPPTGLHLSSNPALPVTFTQGEAAEGPDGDPEAKSTALEIVPHDWGSTGWQALGAELSWLWTGVSWGGRKSYSPGGAGPQAQAQEH